MKPLPERPQFPVYGLPATFDGLRWLLMWQRRIDVWTGDLTEVDLAHGHPNDGPFVVVSSVLKQAGRDRGHGASAGPIGLEYVASNLVGRAIDVRGGSREERRRVWVHERGLIEGSASGGAVLHEWSVGTVSVDSVEVHARTRDIGDARAIAVEYPSHVVGLIGPARLLARPALTDVSADLNTYLAGTDQRADSLLA